MPDDSRLHIDDDWKAEAAREKQRLTEEVDSTEERPPPADFLGIINTLAMQAMVGLGALGGAPGQQIPPNPEIAKHYIDLLDVLDRKTQGQLTPDEKKALDATLYHLRLAYVELTTALAQGPTPPRP